MSREILAESNKTFFEVELLLYLITLDFAKEFRERAQRAHHGSEPVELSFLCWGETRASVVFTDMDVHLLARRGIDHEGIADLCARAPRSELEDECEIQVGDLTVSFRITGYKKNASGGAVAVVKDPIAECTKDKVPLWRTVLLHVTERVAA